MIDETTANDFVTELYRALHCLYDPMALRRSPLARLLGLDRDPDSGPALRRLLLDAIEALKPAPVVPAHSPGWQVYRVLLHRYTEQFTQETVAQELGFSQRQLRRQEKKAIAVLADSLVAHYDLDLAAFILSGQPASTPSREEELAQFQQGLPAEPVEVAAILAAVLRTVDPLMRSLVVKVISAVPPRLPRLHAPPALVRQALLNIVVAAIRAAPTGQVAVSAGLRMGRVYMQTRVIDGLAQATSPEQAENLAMAHKLATLARGTLDVSPVAVNELFHSRLTLPAERTVTVLVIDDNRDTLQLLERYLVGTCYRFAPLTDPAKALSTIEAEAPQVIVLDVMLPGIDGWELLGSLRAHPRTQNVPIILCTILAEETLAAALGAAAFLRKPITRETFLQALDAQAVPLGIEYP